MTNAPPTNCKMASLFAFNFPGRESVGDLRPCSKSGIGGKSFAWHGLTMQISIVVLSCLFGSGLILCWLRKIFLSSKHFVRWHAQDVPRFRSWISSISGRMRGRRHQDGASGVPDRPWARPSDLPNPGRTAGREGRPLSGQGWTLAIFGHFLSLFLPCSFWLNRIGSREMTHQQARRRSAEGFCLCRVHTTSQLRIRFRARLGDRSGE